MFDFSLSLLFARANWDDWDVEIRKLCVVVLCFCVCVDFCVNAFSHIMRQVIVIVEAVKNLCAVSLIRGYEEYLEFNLRKFTALHCEEAAVVAVAVAAEVSSNILDKTVTPVTEEI